MYIYIYIINDLHISAQNQRSPTISYISQEQFKDIGGTAELVCSVQYLGKYPLIWIKQDSHNGIPISSASNLLVADSRFSIRHDQVKLLFFSFSN